MKIMMNLRKAKLILVIWAKFASENLALGVKYPTCVNIIYISSILFNKAVASSPVEIFILNKNKSIYISKC